MYRTVPFNGAALQSTCIKLYCLVVLRLKRMYRTVPFSGAALQSACIELYRLVVLRYKAHV